MYPMPGQKKIKTNQPEKLSGEKSKKSNQYSSEDFLHLDLLILSDFDSFIQEEGCGGGRWCAFTHAGSICRP